MTKNIIITILTLLLVTTSSIAVFANGGLTYRTSFWVRQETNKVDINTYQFENMSCVIVTSSTNAPQAYREGLRGGNGTQSISEGYGSNSSVSCIKNN
jgi:hypothetical protein